MKDFGSKWECVSLSPFGCRKRDCPRQREDRIRMTLRSGVPLSFPQISQNLVGRPPIPSWSSLVSIKWGPTYTSVWHSFTQIVVFCLCWLFSVVSLCFDFPGYISFCALWSLHFIEWNLVCYLQGQSSVLWSLTFSKLTKKVLVTKFWWFRLSSSITFSPVQRGNELWKLT